MFQGSAVITDELIIIIRKLLILELHDGDLLKPFGKLSKSHKAVLVICAKISARFQALHGCLCQCIEPSIQLRLRFHVPPVVVYYVISAAHLCHDLLCIENCVML